MRTGKTISKATRETFKKTLAFAQIQEWCKIHQLSRQKADSLLSKLIHNSNWASPLKDTSISSAFVWQTSKEGYQYWCEIHAQTGAVTQPKEV